MRLKTRRVTVEIPVDDNGVFKVQELKRFEIATILGPCREMFSEKGDDPMEKFAKACAEMEEQNDFSLLVNFGKAFQQLFSSMVIGWRNIQDEDGSDLEFNRENISKIIEFDEDGFVYKFVVEALAKIKDKQDQTRKNCKAGPLGSSTPNGPAAKNAESLNLGIVETATARNL